MPRLNHRALGQRGSLSLFAVVVVTGLFVAIGLVVDGGGKMRASQHADAVAAEAARMGAQQISSDTLVHGSPPRADAARAAAAAQSYLAQAGVEGSVQVNGATISVATSTSYTPTFLNAIGIGTMAVDGHATVELVRGM